MRRQMRALQTKPGSVCLKTHNEPGPSEMKMCGSSYAPFLPSFCPFGQNRSRAAASKVHVGIRRTDLRGRRREEVQLHTSRLRDTR